MNEVGKFGADVLNVDMQQTGEKAKAFNGPICT